MKTSTASGRVNSVFVHCRAAGLDTQCGEVSRALGDLGQSAELFVCCWYVQTELTASDVKAKLVPALGAADALVVIDATNHEAAWGNVGPEAAELIRQTWENGALRMPALESPPLLKSRSGTPP